MKSVNRLFSLSIQAVLACLALTAFSVVSHAQTADDDVLVIDSNLVVLNASVLDDKGSPILGLKQKNFHIFEDGAEQKLDFFEAEETPFAAVILIDTSGSMESRVSIARSAAITFLDGLRDDDMVAIYHFDSKVSKIQDFSQSRDIPEAAYDMKASGMTKMYDAVFQAVQDLSKRPEKRKAILVLSDGEDTDSSKSADKALKASIAVNATVFTVDMSAVDDMSAKKRQNVGILKNFADKSGGRFFSAFGSAGLRDALKNVVSELGTQYTFGYQPSNTAKDGKYRAIEVKVTKQNATVRTRKGYTAPKK
jgi:Ca-activated chloride channel family protein